MINTTINNAAADLSKTASIVFDRAIFLSDTVHMVRTVLFLKIKTNVKYLLLKTVVHGKEYFLRRGKP